MEGDHDEQQTSKVGVVMKVDSEDLWSSIVNQGPHIVAHFTACWCMPSVAMIPFFDELASSHPDITFVTVDVDDLKEVASKMDVKVMPTFILMKGGKQIEKIIGANPDEIRNMIDRFVQSA